MLQRTLLVAVCLLVGSLSAYAQTDRGTLTGTISDPAGAVVPNATLEVRNSETGAVYQGGSSATGNYVFSLPRGTYELTATVMGFKRYQRANLEIPVATTVRADVTLEVGNTTETITVTDVTPLLKTESGDVSYNIQADRANVLPVLTIGTSANVFGSIRNPLQVVSLLPGTQFAADSNLRVNGLPSNTGTIRVEGQDASNGLWRQQASQVQQGMEAIEEVAIQTSNYAAEYGQAAGGYFNFNMKSGTNAYHGSIYDYYVNEFLNAGLPYTDAGTTNSLKRGEHVRNRQRRNDYGMTVGGPIWLPKIYDGHDKTFFFFNWEQFRETRTTSNGLTTVPTAAYRAGNFSTSIPTCTGTAVSCVGGQTFVLQSGALARDQLGRNIPVQGVYDPKSTFTHTDGSLARNLFPGNQIPVGQLDRVALAIQNKLPAATNSALFNNYNIPEFSNPKTTSIPSIKLDHNLSSTAKISGYLSRTLTNQPNHNGLDEVLTGVAPPNNRSTTVRINYDQTLSPTLLLHVGAGYLYLLAPARPQRFDQNSIGLVGFYSDTFPSFGTQTNGTQGGNGINIGAGVFANHQQWDQKPTGNVNLTWVKNNHTFKFGGEMIIDGVINDTDARANGIFGLSQNQTRNLWENGAAGLTGGSGFTYASFLLGQVNSLQTSPKANMRLGNHSISGFAQDTWKVTRRLTLDYGLRYDFQTYLKEQYGRMQSADFDRINKTVNYPGTVRYEGHQPGQCQCNFSRNYPYAFGPRVGVAYQIDSKTVLRGGTAFSYGTASNNSFLSLSIADFYTINAPGFGQNALPEGLQAGNPYRVGNPYGNPPFTFPNFDPDKYPTRTVCPGTLNATCFAPQSPFIEIDRDARPPRIFQYSISLQREIMKDLVVEASYVGNRGVWFTAPALSTHSYNTLTFDTLRQYGLDINSAADRTLLTTPMGNQFTGALNATMVQRGFQRPYQGFPITQNLTTGLVPRPHWGSTIPPFLGPPLGKTWYDSLQVQMTKRYSHGLDLQANLTYGRELSLGANADSAYAGVPATTRINDVFNRDTNKQLSPLSRPFAFVVSGNYTTPGFAAESFTMKMASHVVRDWTVGLVFRYQSGALFAVPNSNASLFAQLNRGGGLFSGGDTYYNFAPGKGPGDAFLKDPNCGCFDPQKDLVLDAAAWQDAPAGQFATTAAYYNQYRWQRQPQENMSIGRNFRIGKESRMNLNVRAEFQNIFNRHFYSTPTSGNPNTVVQSNNPLYPVPPGQTGTGALSQGFGYSNWVNGAGSQPRTGLLVGRFTF
jgi:hypothetical protein